MAISILYIRMEHTSKQKNYVVQCCRSDEGRIVGVMTLLSRCPWHDYRVQLHVIDQSHDAWMLDLRSTAGL